MSPSHIRVYLRLQVDTDGGGSIGFAEFKAWWIQDKAKSTAEKRPVLYTFDALSKNLEYMVAWTLRNKLEELAQFFRLMDPL